MKTTGARQYHQIWGLRLLSLGALFLIILTFVPFSDAKGGLVVTRDDRRYKREVGPVGVGVNGQNNAGHQSVHHRNHHKNNHNEGHRKYRRLQHSINVQADIRSR